MNISYSEVEILSMLLGTLDTCDQFGIPPKLTAHNLSLLIDMQRKVNEELAYWKI